ncbi:MAG: hypothetical protein ACFB14_03235 [Leptolyngbyaceae cyanobacterium]
MVQLITFLLIVAALLILVLQNLSPALSLVVLGTPTVALPLSLWLLGAIAAGVILTLVIYQLVPTKRPYRPMGQRLSDPASEPTNRFVDAPSEPAPNQYERQPTGNHQNPYDTDWETFKAPEQWDDWGQQSGRTPSYTADQTYREAPRPSDAVGDTVRDIETGWGDDDYAASARYASRQDADPDMGWDEQRDDRSDGPSPRTYEEGWLYGSDDEAPVSSEPEEPKPEDSEDVYDANYRVIIPPYEPNDKDG